MKRSGKLWFALYWEDVHILSNRKDWSNDGFDVEKILGHE